MFFGTDDEGSLEIGFYVYDSIKIIIQFYTERCLYVFWTTIKMINASLEEHRGICDDKICNLSVCLI